jgi:hypothetical protein
VIRITMGKDSFGPANIPDCSECRVAMKIFGRESDPDHAGYELQSFYCEHCGGLATKTVGEYGKPPPRN